MPLSLWCPGAKRTAPKTTQACTETSSATLATTKAETTSAALAAFDTGRQDGGDFYPDGAEISRDGGGNFHLDVGGDISRQDDGNFRRDGGGDG